MHFEDLRRLRDTFQHLSPEALAQEEAFWEALSRAYSPTSDFINLENGYYGVMPQHILEAQLAHTRRLNAQNTFLMRSRKDALLAELKDRLAPLIGCTPDCIAFTRNATESLNLLINGIALEPGDEVIMARQDYPTGLEALHQRAQRDGIVPVLIDLPLKAEDPQAIVACFEKAITPRTRLMLVTEIIHWTGQILPVSAIVEMAHRHGVEVITDAAHAFAQLTDATVANGTDYWLANLHKWLGGPLTAGVVVIRKDLIAKVKPLLASVHKAPDDITKLENTSAIPLPVFMTIFDAIDYHLLLTTPVKEARLHLLKSYWTSQVRQLPGVELYTPLEKGRSCAIANFGLKGWQPGQLANALFEQHSIFTVGFDNEVVQGVRVTPQFYNTLADLDALVAAIRVLHDAGL